MVLGRSSQTWTCGPLSFTKVLVTSTENFLRGYHKGRTWEFVSGCQILANKNLIHSGDSCGTFSVRNSFETTVDWTTTWISLVIEVWVSTRCSVTPETRRLKHPDEYKSSFLSKLFTEKSLGRPFSTKDTGKEKLLIPTWRTKRNLYYHRLQSTKTSWRFHCDR